MGIVVSKKKGKYYPSKEDLASGSGATLKSYSKSQGEHEGAYGSSTESTGKSSKDKKKEKKEKKEKKKKGKDKEYSPSFDISKTIEHTSVSDTSSRTQSLSYDVDIEQNPYEHISFHPDHSPHSSPDRTPKHEQPQQQQHLQQQDQKMGQSDDVEENVEYISVSETPSKKDFHDDDHASASDISRHSFDDYSRKSVGEQPKADSEESSKRNSKGSDIIEPPSLYDFGSLESSHHLSKSEERIVIDVLHNQPDYVPPIIKDIDFESTNENEEHTEPHVPQPEYNISASQSNAHDSEMTSDTAIVISGTQQGKAGKTKDPPTYEEWLGQHEPIVSAETFAKELDYDIPDSWLTKARDSLQHTEPSDSIVPQPKKRLYIKKQAKDIKPTKRASVGEGEKHASILSNESTNDDSVTDQSLSSDQVKDSDWMKGHWTTTGKDGKVQVTLPKRDWKYGNSDTDQDSVGIQFHDEMAIDVPNTINDRYATGTQQQYWNDQSNATFEEMPIDVPLDFIGHAKSRDDDNVRPQSHDTETAANKDKRVLEDTSITITTQSTAHDYGSSQDSDDELSSAVDVSKVEKIEFKHPTQKLHSHDDSYQKIKDVDHGKKETMHPERPQDIPYRDTSSAEHLGVALSQYMIEPIDLIPEQTAQSKKFNRPLLKCITFDENTKETERPELVTETKMGDNTRRSEKTVEVSSGKNYEVPCVESSDTDSSTVEVVVVRHEKDGSSKSKPVIQRQDATHSFQLLPTKDHKDTPHKAPNKTQEKSKTIDLTKAFNRPLSMEAFQDRRAKSLPEREKYVDINWTEQEMELWDKIEKSTGTLTEMAPNTPNEMYNLRVERTEGIQPQIDYTKLELKELVESAIAPKLAVQRYVNNREREHSSEATERIWDQDNTDGMNTNMSFQRPKNNKSVLSSPDEGLPVLQRQLFGYYDNTADAYLQGNFPNENGANQKRTKNVILKSTDYSVEELPKRNENRSVDLNINLQRQRSDRSDSEISDDESKGSQGEYVINRSPEDKISQYTSNVFFRSNSLGSQQPTRKKPIKKVLKRKYSIDSEELRALQATTEKLPPKSTKAAFTLKPKALDNKTQVHVHQHKSDDWKYLMPSSNISPKADEKCLSNPASRHSEQTEGSSHRKSTTNKITATSSRMPSRKLLCSEYTTDATELESLKAELKHKGITTSPEKRPNIIELRKQFEGMEPFNNNQTIGNGNIAPAMKHMSVDKGLHIYPIESEGSRKESQIRQTPTQRHDSTPKLRKESTEIVQARLREQKSVRQKSKNYTIDLEELSSLKFTLISKRLDGSAPPQTHVDIKPQLAFNGTGSTEARYPHSTYSKQQDSLDIRTPIFKQADREKLTPSFVVHRERPKRYDAYTTDIIELESLKAEIEYKGTAEVSERQLTVLELRKKFEGTQRPSIQLDEGKRKDETKKKIPVREHQPIYTTELSALKRTSDTPQKKFMQFDSTKKAETGKKPSGQKETTIKPIQVEIHQSSRSQSERKLTSQSSVTKHPGDAKQIHEIEHYALKRSGQGYDRTAKHGVSDGYRPTSRIIVREIPVQFKTDELCVNSEELCALKNTPVPSHKTRQISKLDRPASVTTQLQLDMASTATAQLQQKKPSSVTTQLQQKKPSSVTTQLQQNKPSSVATQLQLDDKKTFKENNSKFTNEPGSYSRENQTPRQSKMSISNANTNLLRPKNIQIDEAEIRALAHTPFIKTKGADRNVMLRRKSIEKGEHPKHRYSSAVYLQLDGQGQTTQRAISHPLRSYTVDEDELKSLSAQVRYQESHDLIKDETSSVNNARGTSHSPDADLQREVPDHTKGLSSLKLSLISLEVETEPARHPTEDFPKQKPDKLPQLGSRLKERTRLYSEELSALKGPSGTSKIGKGQKPKIDKPKPDQKTVSVKLQARHTQSNVASIDKQTPPVKGNRGSKKHPELQVLGDSAKLKPGQMFKPQVSTKGTRTPEPHKPKIIKLTKPILRPISVDATELQALEHTGGSHLLHSTDSSHKRKSIDAPTRQKEFSLGISPGVSEYPNLETASQPSKSRPSQIPKLQVPVDKNIPGKRTAQVQPKYAIPENITVDLTELQALKKAEGRQEILNPRPTYSKQSFKQPVSTRDISLELNPTVPGYVELSASHLEERIRTKPSVSLAEKVPQERARSVQIHSKYSAPISIDLTELQALKNAEGRSCVDSSPKKLLKKTPEQMTSEKMDTTKNITLEMDQDRLNYIKTKDIDIPANRRTTEILKPKVSVKRKIDSPPSDIYVDMTELQALKWAEGRTGMDNMHYIGNEKSLQQPASTKTDITVELSHAAPDYATDKGIHLPAKRQMSKPHVSLESKIPTERNKSGQVKYIHSKNITIDVEELKALKQAGGRYILCAPQLTGKNENANPIKMEARKDIDLEPKHRKLEHSLRAHNLTAKQGSMQTPDGNRKVIDSRSGYAKPKSHYTLPTPITIDIEELQSINTKSFKVPSPLKPENSIDIRLPTNQEDRVYHEPTTPSRKGKGVIMQLSKPGISVELQHAEELGQSLDFQPKYSLLRDISIDVTEIQALKHAEGREGLALSRRKRSVGESYKSRERTQQDKNPKFSNSVRTPLEYIRSISIDTTELQALKWAEGRECLIDPQRQHIKRSADESDKMKDRGDKNLKNETPPCVNLIGGVISVNKTELQALQHAEGREGFNSQKMRETGLSDAAFNLNLQQVQPPYDSQALGELVVDKPTPKPRKRHLKAKAQPELTSSNIPEVHSKKWQNIRPVEIDAVEAVHRKDIRRIKDEDRKSIKSNRDSTGSYTKSYITNLPIYESELDALHGTRVEVKHQFQDKTPDTFESGQFDNSLRYSTELSELEALNYTNRQPLRRSEQAKPPILQQDMREDMNQSYYTTYETRNAELEALKIASLQSKEIPLRVESKSLPLDNMEAITHGVVPLDQGLPPGIDIQELMALRATIRYNADRKPHHSLISPKPSPRKQAGDISVAGVTQAEVQNGKPLIPNTSHVNDFPVYYDELMALQATQAYNFIRRDHGLLKQGSLGKKPREETLDGTSRITNGVSHSAVNPVYMYELLALRATLEYNDRRLNIPFDGESVSHTTTTKTKPVTKPITFAYDVNPSTSGFETPHELPVDVPAHMREQQVRYYQSRHASDIDSVNTDQDNTQSASIGEIEALKASQAQSGITKPKEDKKQKKDKKSKDSDKTKEGKEKEPKKRRSFFSFFRRKKSKEPTAEGNEQAKSKAEKKAEKERQKQEKKEKKKAKSEGRAERKKQGMRASAAFSQQTLYFPESDHDGHAEHGDHHDSDSSETNTNNNHSNSPMCNPLPFTTSQESFGSMTSVKSEKKLKLSQSIIKQAKLRLTRKEASRDSESSDGDFQYALPYIGDGHRRRAVTEDGVIHGGQIINSSHPTSGDSTADRELLNEIVHTPIGPAVDIRLIREKTNELHPAAYGLHQLEGHLGRDDEQCNTSEDSCIEDLEEDTPREHTRHSKNDPREMNHSEATEKEEFLQQLDSAYADVENQVLEVEATISPIYCELGRPEEAVSQDFNQHAERSDSEKMTGHKQEKLSKELLSSKSGLYQSMPQLIRSPRDIHLETPSSPPPVKIQSCEELLKFSLVKNKHESLSSSVRGRQKSKRSVGDVIRKGSDRIRRSLQKLRGSKKSLYDDSNPEEYRDPNANDMHRRLQFLEHVTKTQTTPYNDTAHTSQGSASEAYCTPTHTAKHQTHSIDTESEHQQVKTTRDNKFCIDSRELEALKVTAFHKQYREETPSLKIGSSISVSREEMEALKVTVMYRDNACGDMHRRSSEILDNSDELFAPENKNSESRAAESVLETRHKMCTNTEEMCALDAVMRHTSKSHASNVEEECSELIHTSEEGTKQASKLETKPGLNNSVLYVCKEELEALKATPKERISCPNPKHECDVIVYDTEHTQESSQRDGFYSFEKPVANDYSLEQPVTTARNALFRSGFAARDEKTGLPLLKRVTMEEGGYSRVVEIEPLVRDRNKSQPSAEVATPAENGHDDEQGYYSVAGERRNLMMIARGQLMWSAPADAEDKQNDTTLASDDRGRLNATPTDSRAAARPAFITERPLKRLPLRVKKNYPDIFHVTQELLDEYSDQSELLTSDSEDMEGYHPAGLFEPVAKMVRMPETARSIPESHHRSDVPPVRLRSEINPLRELAGLPPLSVVQIAPDQIPPHLKAGLIQVLPVDVPRSEDPDLNQVKEDKENTKSEEQSTVSKDDASRSGDRISRDAHKHKHKRRTRDRVKRENESQISSVTVSVDLVSEEEREKQRQERKKQKRREKRKEKEKEKESLKSSSDEEQSNHSAGDRKKKTKGEDRKKTTGEDRKKKGTEENESLKDSDATLTNENVAYEKSGKVDESKDGRGSSPKSRESGERGGRQERIPSDDSDKKDREKSKMKFVNKNKQLSDNERNVSKDKQTSSSKRAEKERERKTASPDPRKGRKGSRERREHRRSQSKERKREERREDKRNSSRKSDKSSKDRKKKTLLRRTSSASTIADVKSGRNMRALPRTRTTSSTTLRRQRKKELMQHLEAQKVEVSKSEEVRQMAQVLINDVYLRQDKKMQKMIDETYPPRSSRKHQSRDDSQSRDDASLPPLSPGSYQDSHNSIYTEPIRGSRREADSSDNRPTSALNRLYSEGSLKGYSPRSAVHSYMPSRVMAYGQRYPTSSQAWHVSDAIASSFEKERLLDAVRHELRHMKQPIK